MSANLFWHEQPNGFAEYLDREVCDDYKQNFMFLLAAIRNHGFYTATQFPSGGRVFKGLPVDTLTAQEFMPRKVGIDKAHYYGDHMTLIRVECDHNGHVTNIAYTGLDAERLESLTAFLEPYSKKRVYPRPEGRFYMLGYRNRELYFQQLAPERSRFVPANYSVSVRDHFKYVAHQIAARNPDGRLVLIDGPPGTGKRISSARSRTRSKIASKSSSSPPI